MDLSKGSTGPMLTKLVESRGKNYLAQFHWQTAPPHILQMVKHHSFSCMDMTVNCQQDWTFYIPTIRVPTTESDYAKKLFAELKVARHLAKQNIGKA